MLRCPACERAVMEDSYIEVYVSPFNGEEYKLYHCLSCDLEWWEPLKIIPEFYEEEGDEGYTAFHLGIREDIGENHKMFFKEMTLKAGRLLDIGSVPNRDSWVHKAIYPVYFPQSYYPPNHFLLFSKQALSNLLSNFNFKIHSLVSPKERIKDITFCLTILLGGYHFTKRLKRVTFGNELFSEGSRLYKEAPLFKKVAFKGLKLFRDVILFLPAVIIKNASQGMHLYFQGENNG